MSFKINSENYEIVVNKPDLDPDGWTVVKQESLSYDKGSMILSKFNEEFPNLAIDSYELLCKICSRSRSLNEWLITKNLEFSEYSQLPLFLVDKITPASYKTLQVDIVKLNGTVAAFAKKRELLAREYEANLVKLEAEELKEVVKLKGNNKILKVLALNSTYLPITIQLAIENYIPTDSLADSRRTYGRECLIQYKSALIDLIIDNPDINIDDVINSSVLK